MKQHICRFASCVLSLALLLTLCPMIGSASVHTETQSSAGIFGESSLLHRFVEGGITSTSQFSTDAIDRFGSADTQYVRAPEAVPETTDAVESYLILLYNYNLSDGSEPPFSVRIQYTISGPNGYNKTGTSTGQLGGRFGPLEPGTYTVTVDQSVSEVDGYTLIITGAGSITIEAGKDATMTISFLYTPVSVTPMPEPEPEPEPTPEPAPPTYGPTALVIITSVSGGGYAATGKMYSIVIQSNSGASTYSFYGSDNRAIDVSPGEYVVSVDRDSASIDGYILRVSGEGPITLDTGEQPNIHIMLSYEPEPESTPSPVDTPEPTSTPLPTETPEPTPTPTPSTTPTPTSTAEPEPNYTPEPSSTPSSTPTPTPDAVPDIPVYVEDLDETIDLPVSLLDQIESIEDAVEAVRTMASRLTAEQKKSHAVIDIATLFAERALSKAAAIDIGARDAVWINAALLREAQGTMEQATAMIEKELEDGGIDIARKMPRTVVLNMGNRTSFVAKIDPDVLTTDVDKVRVETDQFAITFKLEDLAPDLDGVLTITAKEVDNQAGNDEAVVQLTMPDGGLANPITLSLRAGYSEIQYETMMLNGEATPSKYNPVTISMDGKTTSSGTYTTDTNEVDFSDISGKSEEMQEAIKNLASRGILVGTSETTFSPDESISRAEIATLLVRVLGLYDEEAIPTYTDVTKSDWYYVGAASSQRAKLMSGYGDNKFHGKDVISKEQIMAASGNVLIEYMDYEVPFNPDTYLKRYIDEVPEWGRDTIALVTQENLVIYRTDNKFLGTSDMTRGDAAIVINRLFRRIW